MAGLQPGPPDYVGVGTARSGTSWWDSLINEHPRVFRLASTPKEVHFFDGLWARACEAETSSDTTRCSRGPRAHQRRVDAGVHAGRLDAGAAARGGT